MVKQVLKEEKKREEIKKDSTAKPAANPLEVKSHTELEWYEEAKKALESAKLGGDADLKSKDEDNKTAPNKLGPGEIIKLD